MEPLKAVFIYGKATVRLEGGPDEIQKCLESGSVSKHLMSAAAATKSEGQVDDETFELALEHGWEWFSLHADHRMKSVHFFLISVAFLTAAYVTALRFSHPGVALGVSIVGILLTIAFSRIELRIRELIKASEAALKPLQATLAVRTSIEHFKLFEVVEQGKNSLTKYSTVVGALHLIAVAMFALGAWHAYQLPRG
jgi:hypothetical protein